MKKSESKSIYIVIGVVVAFSIIATILTTKLGIGSKGESKGIEVENEVKEEQVKLDKLALKELHEIFMSKYPNSFIKEINYRDINKEIYYEVEGQDDSKEYKLIISNQGEIIDNEEEELDFQSEFKAKLKGFELEDIKKLKPMEEIIETGLKEVDGELKSIKFSKRKGRFIFDIGIDDVEVIIDGETKEMIRVERKD